MPAEHFKLMIPGASTNDGSIDITAPFDGSLIATAEAADAEAVEKALSTADALFKGRDRWLTPHERIAILEKAADIIKNRADSLALEAAREGGKPLIDSKVEVARAIDSVKLCVESLRTQSGTETPMNLNPASANHLAFTRLEPIGPVVAVSAFNHPLNLIVHQAGPAVAAGCPVIVKPAEDTPISCFRFVQILREVGLPEEWCQALVVKDLTVAEKLVTDKRVAFFSFIGSGKVGWMLRSKLAPGTRCALEHGGAAPVIFAEDADINYAVPLLAKGGFYHAGQVCVSVQRVFAHESVARTLAERLAEAGKRMKVGDPVMPDTDVGPLIRNRDTDRIEEWVNEAVESGAELISGGKKLSESTYSPTVLFNPPENAKVSTMEIFGPVICVYSYSIIDDAIKRANGLPFSFQASVFTRDIDTAMRASSRIDASSVMINDHTAFRVDWMPFAGFRESGYGTGGIPFTMKDMQNEKQIVLRSKEL
ncbi:aldehyde dehydrogenase family protein [candidate division KSB1 bacterium]